MGGVWGITGCPSILQTISLGSNWKCWFHWTQISPSGYGLISSAGFLCCFVCTPVLLYLLPIALLSLLPLSYLPWFVFLYFSSPQSKWILIRTLSSVSLCPDLDCPTKYHLEYCCLGKKPNFLIFSAMHIEIVSCLLYSLVTEWKEHWTRFKIWEYIGYNKIEESLHFFFSQVFSDLFLPIHSHTEQRAKVYNLIQREFQWNCSPVPTTFFAGLLFFNTYSL